MRHYLYVMKSDAKDPIGIADMKSWFEYYKVEVEETFLPTQNQMAYPLKKGEWLWFLMDQTLIGYAEISRDVADIPPGSVPDRLEIWYDSNKIHRIDLLLNGPWEEGFLPENLVRDLLQKVGRTLPTEGT